jgi:hypothetical protein
MRLESVDHESSLSNYITRDNGTINLNEEINIRSKVLRFFRVCSVKMYRLG